MSKPLVVLTTLLPLAAILLYAGAPRDPQASGIHGVLGRGRMQSVPRTWVPRNKSERWECIVVHHSATPMGGAARFDRAHRERGFDELGYHFVIGNGTDTGDGQIEVGPRWPKQKWGAHAKTPDNQFNERGIGICLVGNFDNERPTPAQMASLSKLVTYLMKTYKIRAQDVIGHGETKATDCPGRYINVAAFRRQLAAGLADASKTDGDIILSLDDSEPQPASITATDDGSNP